MYKKSHFNVFYHFLFKNLLMLVEHAVSHLLR